MSDSIFSKIARSAEVLGKIEYQGLEDHLRGVALLCAEETARFGCRKTGELLGLWHDLGKYSEEFQNYLRAASDLEATSEGLKGKVNHSTAGAIFAFQQLPQIGRFLAYVIAGHHRGLPDWQAEERPLASLKARLEETEHLSKALNGLPPDSITQTGKDLQERPPSSNPKHCYLWVRMLFSSLVDADCLNSEAFSDKDAPSLRDSLHSISVKELLERFETYISNLKNKARKSSVNDIRSQILAACNQASTNRPGIFSLTVPTGGGKTLSAMSFALRHALKHSKRRIIYVIPYTSIIEQTAEILRSIFGDVVLEHHSSLDPEDVSTANRLASENWDAPIVITTSVQFFDSLFSNRTSKSRKIHNIIDSVVILDEVHLLPCYVLDPIKVIISDLAQNYGVTFVLSSATQPALETLKTHEGHSQGIENIKEIIPNVDELHHKLKRVEVILPKDLQIKSSWEQLAEELSTNRKVLCIVNSRTDCRNLHRLMPSDTHHLSALMCGEHRSQLISQIKSLLKEDREVRIISTQLIEAGVDIDLPVVYRALAGLDSIAQAAGRCNREGLLSKGQVHLFIPPSEIPLGVLKRASVKTKELLSLGIADILHPDTFRRYFSVFYSGEGPRMDKERVCEEISNPNRLNFERAAERFKFIDNSSQCTVIVQFGNEDLLAQLKSLGPSRWLFRKLQRYTVSIYQHQKNRLLARGDISELSESIFIQTNPALYHPVLGFMADDFEDAIISPEQMIC